MVEIIEPKLNKSVTGFRRGSTPILNAQFHLQKKALINIDIENFFPNVPAEWLKTICKDLNKRSKIKKKKKKLGLKDVDAQILFELLTVNNKLAQGLPCSPLLANYYLTESGFDQKIQEICPGWTYTRYADDITLSTQNEVTKNDLIIVKDKIYHLLLSVKMKPCIKKTKLQISKQREDITVTGIKVCRKEPTISKKYINETKRLAKNYLVENTELDDKIKGRLAYIESVNQTQYNKLKHKIEENIDESN